MDVLKNRQNKNYSYISRYSAFNFYYNTEDNKYIYEITSQLKSDINCVTITISDSDTLDSLALKYYGRPDYYWVIADFNKIQDPFITLVDNYTELKIPTLSAIEFDK